MSAYWMGRLLTAAARNFVVYYAATAGERIARKHIRLNVRKPTKPKKRKSRK